MNIIRRANSWSKLGASKSQGEASSFGVPLSPSWHGSRDDRPGGEQPIFSTKAHVFQIDAGTKKDWLPVSKTAVSVSYYYDSTRGTYRIISVDGSKAIVNSTITPTMTFTKTSQKFGQWSDPRANTVYGLGFSTEQELSKFIDKFKEIKEMTRQVPHKAGEVTRPEVNGGPESPQAARMTTPLHTRTNSLSSIQTDASGNLRERRNSFGQSAAGAPSNGTGTEAQLKYENDRLKLALAQSSANAKKWEVELQTLKTNNARLTGALQESTANVEEWKRQLAAYKEETTRLKKKVSDQDKGGGDMVAQLTDQIERIRLDNHTKQEEIKRLGGEIQDLTAKDSQTSSLQARIQELEEENHTLSLRAQDGQRLMSEARGQRDTEHRELAGLQEAMGQRIREMYEAHEVMLATLRKESHS